MNPQPNFGSSGEHARAATHIHMQNGGNSACYVNTFNNPGNYDVRFTFGSQAPAARVGGKATGTISPPIMNSTPYKSPTALERAAPQSPSLGCMSPPPPYSKTA